LVLDEVLFLDPGISNCNMKYVQVAVNPADERNIDPKPDLQDGEEIKTHLVPFNRNLYDSIKDLCSSNGFVLDARLASVALGMKLLPG
jgi:ADP-ribose pyrophosphatase